MQKKIKKFKWHWRYEKTSDIKLLYKTQNKLIKRRFFWTINCIFYGRFYNFVMLTPKFNISFRVKFFVNHNRVWTFNYSGKVATEFIPLWEFLNTVGPLRRDISTIKWLKVEEEERVSSFDPSKLARFWILAKFQLQLYHRENQLYFFSSPTCMECIRPRQLCYMCGWHCNWMNFSEQKRVMYLITILCFKSLNKFCRMPLDSYG